MFLFAARFDHGGACIKKLRIRSEITGNFVGCAMHHAAILYHDEGSDTHGNVVDQPAKVDQPANLSPTDPHGSHGW